MTESISGELGHQAGNTHLRREREGIVLRFHPRVIRTAPGLRSAAKEVKTVSWQDRTRGLDNVPSTVC